MNQRWAGGILFAGVGVCLLIIAAFCFMMVMGSFEPGSTAHPLLWRLATGSVGFLALAAGIASIWRACRISMKRG